MLDIPKVVGFNVRRLREERGWSGVHLAQIIGATPQHVSGVENGSRGLSTKQITILCEAFACLPEELFYLPDDVDHDRLKLQLRAEMAIMDREDVARLCSMAVSLNASKGKIPNMPHD